MEKATALFEGGSLEQGAFAVIGQTVSSWLIVDGRIDQDRLQAVLDLDLVVEVDGIVYEKGKDPTPRVEVEEDDEDYDYDYDEGEWL